MTKKKKPIYNGIEFDSNEEIEFYQWCEEALSCGVIGSFEYHTVKYDLFPGAKYEKTEQLKTKARVKNLSLLRSHIYTPDFILTPKIDGIFIDVGKFYTIVDVKGGFQQFHDGKVFSMSQKWVYQKYGIYVEKIVPEKFFAKTWVPEKARWTLKTGKLKNKYLGYPVVDDFMKNINGEMS